MVRDKKGGIQVGKKKQKQTKQNAGPEEPDQGSRSDGKARVYTIKSKEGSREEVIQKSTEMAQGWVLKDPGKQSR